MISFAANAGTIPIIIDDIQVMIPCGNIQGNAGVGGAQLVTSNGRTVTADAAGNYSIQCLPVGDHVVTVSAPNKQYMPNQLSASFRATDLTTKILNFAPVINADPQSSSFWSGVSSAEMRTHNGMLSAALRQACANNYYPQYTCLAAAPQVSDVAKLEVAKNHDINGCSALDGMAPGPWLKEGGGILSGIDNLWFRRSCNNHDNCFHHGFDPAWKSTANAGTWGGDGSLAACNDWFQRDNRETCQYLDQTTTPGGLVVVGGTLSGGVKKLACLAMADFFYGVVNLWGHQNYHTAPRLSSMGQELACSPKVTGAYTTGSLGTTMKVDTPLADPDPYCHPAPTNLALSSRTSTSIGFSWGTSRDATGYRVYRNGNAITSTITSTTYNNLGLSPNTSYQYYVKAIFDDLKESPASNVITVTTDPVITCGGAIAASGGVEGYRKTMDLGDKSGVVNVRFNAFSIPDAALIRSQGSGTPVIFSTGGFVSGVQTGGYNYSYSLGNVKARYVDIFVDTNDANTAWEMQVSCPGQPLPTVTYQMRNVVFTVRDNTCGVPWAISVDGAAFQNMGFLGLTKSMEIRPGHSIRAGWTGTCSGSKVPGDLWYQDGSGTYKLYPGVYGNGSAPTFFFSVR